MRWYICIFVLCITTSVDAQNNSQLAELKKTYALYQKHNSAGDYVKALPYMEKAYELSKKVFGELHSNTLASLNRLGLLYRNQGRYEKAEPLYLKCLQLRKQKLGENHPDTLASLGHLAGIYGKQGRDDKAEPLILKCLQLRKQILGENHPDTLVSLNNLGLLYQNQGRYDKAEPLLLKCVRIKKQTLSENHSSLLTSLNNLGLLYLHQRSYDKAETLFLKCLRLRKQKFGENHSSTLSSLNNLAALYFDQEKYGKAEPLLLKCLQLTKQKLGENHPDTLRLLNNLAALYEGQGKYDKAESFYLKCLHLTKQILGENHPDTLMLINNLAVLYGEQGKDDKAEPLFLKSLLLAKQKNNENHPLTLSLTNNLGLLYLRQGKHDKAETLFLKCLLRTKQIFGENHPSTLTSIHNLTLLYDYQGRHDKAESLYLKRILLTKQKIGENHPSILWSINGLAALYLNQKRHNEAEPLVLKSLWLTKQIFGENHPNTLRSINRLAKLYESQGKYDKVEPLYLKCLQLRKQKLGENHPHTLISINNLAVFYLRQRRYNKTEPLLFKCLQLRKQKLGENHPSTLESINNLGFLYFHQGRYDKAEKILDEWFSKRNEYLHNQLLSMNKKTQKSYLKQDRNAIKALFSLYLRKNNPNIGKKLINYSLQRKGILLHFSPDTISRSNRADENIKEVLELLQSQRATLSLWILNPPKNVPNEQLKANIHELREKIEQNEGELASLSKDFRRAKQKITVATLQEKLNNTEVVVDFLVIQIKSLKNKKLEDLPEQLIATITTKRKVHLVKLGEYSLIEKLIHAYRKKATNPSSWKLNKIAQEVYQKVWKSIDKHCAKHKVIYVIPDGDLHLFPFQAMVDENNRYLLETRNIQMITSARYLTYKIDNYDLASDKPTIFANPSYGNKDRSPKNRGSRFQNIRFSPLPGTAKEGKVITEMLKAKQQQHVTFFTREASKENISKVVAPEFLHIATHGFFLKAPEIKEDKNSRGIIGYSDTIEFTPMQTSPANTANSLSFSTQFRRLPKVENPLLYCGLAFSDANTDQAKGILTAMEVLSLDLSGTELVVLSACDTSVGEVASGEGVYSLRRAFQEAGAKAVLSSLWPASDKGTQHLMTKFYSHYLNKATPQSAIRAAQLECITEGKYAHPYYWANFVMVGSDHLFPQHYVLESISIKQNGSSSLYIRILAILVIMIVIAGIAWLVTLKKQKVVQQQALRKERRQRRLQR